MLKRWSKQEVDFLKMKGKDFTLNQLSRRFNRSINSILKKASKEGISLRSNSWTKEEIKFLKENLGKVPCKKIASKLNKTISSVYHKASRLNIKGRYFDYKDKLKTFNNLCLYCGKKITLKRAHNYTKMFKKQYCSRRCATLGTGRGFTAEKILDLYVKGKMPKMSHTKPERKFKKEMIKIGFIENVDFFHQKRMFKKFLCDFVFPKQKLIIEVQGDYWHANPMFFPRNPNNPEADLYPVQIKTIKKDESKEKYIRKAGWNFIPVWEYDINKNLHVISKVIKSIIDKS